MNCDEARHNWMLYFDSEGDPALRLRVRDHLAACPDCAAWFARQEQLERAVATRLAAGEEAPGLWDRVLAGAGITPRPAQRRRRWLALAGILATAALSLALWLGLEPGERPETPVLARDAADLHERWARGGMRPDLVSASDDEVDRYLKARAPFPVHCPPRTDVAFAVKGAGLCRVQGGQQAAYIVGRVGQAPVSILVLDRRSLAAFPHDQAHLRGGRRHRCREGDYEMISGVVADNVVVVIGTAPPEALERLLTAYGTYHDG
jgi:anti-sigma factor RsiW